MIYVYRHICWTSLMVDRDSVNILDRKAFPCSHDVSLSRRTLGFFNDIYCLTLEHFPCIFMPK